MVNLELLAYVRQSLGQGFEKEKIISELQKSGWSPQDINEAFQQISAPPAPGQTPQTAAMGGELPSGLEILKEAWKIFIDHPLKYIGIYLMPLLAIAAYIIICAVIILLLYAAGLISTMSNPANSISALAAVIFIMIFLTFFLGTIFFTSWTAITLIYSIKNRDQNIGIINSFKNTWSKVFSAWWLQLLSGFILIGGFCLFLVPGYIIAIWFSLAMYILVAEDVRGMNALLKSKEYIKGYGWKVLGRFLIIGLIMIGISFALFIPSIVLTVFKLEQINNIYSSLVNIILGLISAPIIMMYCYLIYEHLRAIKGQFEFVPNPAHRAGFIALGILGPIIFGFIMAFSMYSLMQFTISNLQSQSMNFMGSKNIQEIPGNYPINPAP